MVRDSDEQLAIAHRIVSTGVFVPIAVFLESGWVLRRLYRRDRVQIADALTGLLDIGTVHVGDEPGLRRAIALFREGADLADAIHLVAAGGSEAFVTFDRGLARLPDPPIPVVLAASPQASGQ